MKQERRLDRTDAAILRELQKNARIHNKELAGRVGIAASTCLERVRRLGDAGVFRGFHAELDPEALGIGLQAIIAVRIVRHTRDQVDAFESHAAGLPEVIALFHVGGANDFLVHVAVEDSAALRDLVLEKFTTRPEVEHLETSLLFRYRYNWQMPIYSVSED